MAYYDSSRRTKGASEAGSHRENRQPDDVVRKTRTPYSVKLDMEKNENAVQLKRAQSRVKQVEFELAVMKEVADVRTQQLRDSERLVEELEAELIKAKTPSAPPSPPPPVAEIDIREEHEHIMEPIPAMAQARRVSELEELDNVDEAEVVELRAALEKNQSRLDELEDERNIHLAKVSELLKLLTLQSTSEVERELYVKSLEVAELGGQVEALQKKVEAAEIRAEKLEQEREANIAIVVELSQILSPDVDEGEVNEVFALLQEGKELSSKQAQLLTIHHLTRRVETLEEEKQAFLLASLKDDTSNHQKSGRGAFRFLGGGKT